MAVMKNHHTSRSRLYPCMFQAFFRPHLHIVIVGEHIPKNGLHALCGELLVLFLFQATIGWTEVVCPFQKIKAFPSRVDILLG